LLETIDLLASNYNVKQVAFAGSSFGGAVVISTGARHNFVKAIGIP